MRTAGIFASYAIWMTFLLAVGLLIAAASSWDRPENWIGLIRVAAGGLMWLGMLVLIIASLPVAINVWFIPYRRLSPLRRVILSAALWAGWWWILALISTLMAGTALAIGTFSISGMFTFGLFGGIVGTGFALLALVSDVSDLYRAATIAIRVAMALVIVALFTVRLVSSATN